MSAIFYQQTKLAKNYVRAGVHYGHSVREWNPKMAPYILYQKNGYHIIDLSKTARLLRFAGNIAEKKAFLGKDILFVGTTKISSKIVAKYAKKSKSFSITTRWLGGLLTNWSTIRKRIQKLHYLEHQKTSSSFFALPKKERNIKRKELEKLEKVFNGIKKMGNLPSLVIFTHQLKNKLAIQECLKLGIAVICLTDTNCNPDLVPYLIPANDDSISSVSFLLKYLSNRIIMGRKKRKKYLKTTPNLFSKP